MWYNIVIHKNKEVYIMARLRPTYYYGKGGVQKINCYNVSIPKKVVEESGFTGDELIKIVVEIGKIIIEKEKNTL